MNKLDYVFMACTECNRNMTSFSAKVLKNCVACNSPRLVTFAHADIADEDMDAWMKCLIKEEE